MVEMRIPMNRRLPYMFGVVFGKRKFKTFELFTLQAQLHFHALKTLELVVEVNSSSYQAGCK